MNKERTYIAIDLKSFYASVECVERGLDPLTTNLVVADESRTDKTICLAVSPSLKAYGIGGRARLFEVRQRLREVYQRTGEKVPFIIAKPRMALYIDYSVRVYRTYMKYLSDEDMHPYSIDEVFMDVTDYLPLYKQTAHELAMTMIRDVLSTTGITATAGIGTNLYLAKVAMDIVAKHIPADENGVRIAELDEATYRQQLWDHKPLTAFWRVGKGIAEKLQMFGIDTMGKLARLSTQNDEFLYKLFGVNAELLIDHAWGWEPCTIDYIKAYQPESNSISSGQVLSEPYTFEMARNVVMEMADALSLDLVEKRLVTDQLVLTVSYDRESLTRPEIAAHYHGPVVQDYYGRPAPKHAHGSVRLDGFSSSGRAIVDAVMALYDQVVDPMLLIRRLNITLNHVVREQKANAVQDTQLSLFDDPDQVAKEAHSKDVQQAKERRMQEALLAIKHRYGKNAILKGTSFSKGATARERNNQIGGHHA